ncbi:unnamed protein product [Camellia sinensis]
MANLSMEVFVGNGALKEVLPKLLEEGWDDVSTLKLMNSADMDAIHMTQLQKDALETRSYLHDCSLMQYGDVLEASGKSLVELLKLSTSELSAEFGMKRGHIVRFMNKRGTSSACAAVDPLLEAPHALPSSTKTTPSRYNSINHG